MSAISSHCVAQTLDHVSVFRFCFAACWSYAFQFNVIIFHSEIVWFCPEKKTKKKTSEKKCMSLPRQSAAAQWLNLSYWLIHCIVHVQAGDNNNAAQYDSTFVALRHTDNANKVRAQISHQYNFDADCQLCDCVVQAAESQAQKWQKQSNGYPLRLCKAQPTAAVWM